MYSITEFPLRRGIPKHVREAQDAGGLNQNLFKNLKEKPEPPPRIEYTDVITGKIQESGYDPELSRMQSESLAQREIFKFKREGYMRLGKHSVDIVERARRVYNPEWPEGSPEAILMMKAVQARENKRGSSPAPDDTQSMRRGDKWRLPEKKKAFGGKGGEGGADEEDEGPETGHSMRHIYGMEGKDESQEPQLANFYAPLYDFNIGDVASLSGSVEGSPHKDTDSLHIGIRDDDSTVKVSSAGGYGSTSAFSQNRFNDKTSMFHAASLDMLFP